MPTYELVKSLHIATAMISVTGFVLRGLWMLADSPRLRSRFVRVAPHVNDTLLLASAVWLAVSLRQYPFVHDWLTAKVVALVLYVGLGMAALRHGRTKGVRAAAWVAALVTFGYITAVALTRSPSLGLA